jgi:hypothetical protein
MTHICQCCAGIAVETPQIVTNRGGLSTIAYRSGTWATFKASMLASIGGATAHGLRTRDDADFTIAFLDACAVVGDILTFYDERIANENYLRTATETLSIGELARLIGYTPSPGCSATAFLAFRLNDPAPSPTPSPLAQLSSALGAIVPAGTKTQSVPGPGQTAQTFETAADLDARWVHNALAPLLGLPYTSSDVSGPSIYVASGAGRNVGDTIIVTSASKGTAAVHTVTSILVDPISKNAQLLLDGNVAAGGLTNPPAALASAIAFGPNPFVPNNDPFSDAEVAKIAAASGWDRDALATVIAREQWTIDAFEASVNAANAAVPAGSDVSAFAAKSAALFGNNAPLWSTLPGVLTGNPAPASPPTSYAYPTNWDDPTTNTLATFYGLGWPGAIDLDSVYGSAVPGAAIVFVDGATILAGTIQTAAVVTRNAYALTGRLTSITVTVDGDPGTLHPRTTAVYVQDAALPLVAKPIYGAGQYVEGLNVLLNRCALQLDANRYVAVTGVRSDRHGVTSTEIAQLAAPSLQNGYTLLTFTQALSGAYLPETLTINANIAVATNGETVNEVVGSGDAGSAFQTFTLRQTPLTWTSAAVPSGIAAAITIRVNGIAWALVPDLYGSGPTDRVYMLDTDTSGNTVVRFGDGVTGARIPTGNENVTAVYRRGLGTAGNVDDATITMLLTRPPGLRDVTNPVASSGGADADTVAAARVNAPFSVKTLGRIVTLQDYADFVRASTGIAKARVDLTWTGSTQVVLISVAGAGGTQLDPSGVPYSDLVKAVTAASDGSYPIVIANYRPITFSVAAGLLVDPAYQTDVVSAAVQAALANAFSFDQRDFGQTAFASEAYAVIQSVPGVLAENLQAFCYTQTVPATVDDPLPAQGASISGGSAVGAQLLTLDIIPAVLTVLS